jgi:hypothetical protein
MTDVACVRAFLQDAAFYMCHDRINALVIAPISAPPALDTVLGCQDHCVRIICGGDVVAEARVQGAG